MNLSIDGREKTKVECCSVLFSNMYEKNPLKIVDDKQYQQYKWLLKIVDLEQLVETRPNKVLIYVSIIFKQQKEIVITPIIQWKPNTQRIVFIITPVKGKKYVTIPPVWDGFLAILKRLQCV